MTRAEKINQILQGRQKMADRTEKTMECVRSVASALDDCAALLEKVIEVLEGEQRAKAEQLQRELVRSITEKIPKIHQGVSQLWLRFRRPTFNIGIIGNARQGKSTFLQAITGLTNDEIPAAETDHCTGAPSIIINDHQTYADVEFYDDRSFLEEMILPFYEKLGLTPRPATFRSFADNPLPALQSTSANDQQLWQKLKDRHENSSAYQNLLRQPVKRIERHEFIDYIAQQKQQKEGESFYIEKIYNWIAVKMVTIHCPFNVPDVGGLSVCDTPGLGDFICGAEDNLSRNIGNSIDTVLMLKRVPNGGIIKPEDTQLYDLIPKAIPELDAKDWSYFIVNRDGTTAELEMFQEQVAEKIKVRRLITLDARNEDEVLTEFEGILDDIAINQQVLDNTLYNDRNDNSHLLNKT